MNMTIVGSILFLSFACCIGVIGYLMVKNVEGWGWLLFASLLFYGFTNLSTTDIAECPDCHRVFKLDSSGNEVEKE